MLFLPLFATAQTPIASKVIDTDTTGTTQRLDVWEFKVSAKDNVIVVTYAIDKIGPNGKLSALGKDCFYSRYGTKYDSLQASQVGQMLRALFQQDASVVDSAKNVFRLLQTHP